MSEISKAVSACMDADAKATRLVQIAELATFIMKGCVSPRLALESVESARAYLKTVDAALEEAEGAVRNAIPVIEIAARAAAKDKS
jgi:hypothetical protein